MASQTKQGDLKMFTNKISGKNKKNNSSLTLTDSYDHYIALDWSERNMAIARLSKKDTEPKIIDVPSDIKELKLYLVTHVTQKGKIRHEDSKAQRFHQEKHKLCEDFVSLCLSG